MTTPPRFDPRRRRNVVIALVLVTALASFESTVVSTAMPTIIGDLGGLPLYSWVFSIYLLTATVMMPIYGRLADIYGRRRILLVAITVFLSGRDRVRPRALDAAAHRRARPPGPRRGRAGPDRADRLGRPLLARGARAGAGPLLERVGHGEPRRPAPRRVDDDVLRLALDLHDQHPARHRRVRARRDPDDRVAGDPPRPARLRGRREPRVRRHGAALRRPAPARRRRPRVAGAPGPLRALGRVARPLREAPAPAPLIR